VHHAAEPVCSPTAERGTYEDISHTPCLAHADDYSWLAGQVESSHLGLRLRYASVDDVDRFGGSVTLQGDSSLERLKDGYFVKLRGHVITPGDKPLAPTYHVDAYEFVAVPR
jgi:hypothetical protein